jgi:hypothetical protein
MIALLESLPMYGWISAETPFAIKAAVAERIHTWLETPDTAKQLPQPGRADGTL